MDVDIPPVYAPLLWGQTPYTSTEVYIISREFEQKHGDYIYMYATKETSAAFSAGKKTK
jgi:hypothetical protein